MAAPHLSKGVFGFKEGVFIGKFNLS